MSQCKFEVNIKPLNLQGIQQQTKAADSHESASEELCRLSDTKELAVVETFH